jgi:hypothetical protein
MDEDVISFIQQIFKSESNRFPGAQPISIERRHFPLLKIQDYLISEKTDGVRYFIVSRNGYTVIINRANICTNIVLRLPPDTLLDGELIQLYNGKMCFLVFDAMLIKGVNVMNENYETRLECAQKLIKKIIKTSNASFDIRVKNPVPFRKGFNIPVSDYETDGVILTPNNDPVRMGTHETMFKWKPFERITVDFLIQNGTKLFVQDYGKLFEEGELLLNNKRLDIPNNSIVECGYGKLGWHVVKVRTDKNYPNNRRTYSRTMINLREKITLEEIM